MLTIQAELDLDHVVAVKRELKPGKKPPMTRVGGYICCGGKLVESEQHLREKVRAFSLLATESYF